MSTPGSQNNVRLIPSQLVRSSTSLRVNSNYPLSNSYTNVDSTNYALVYNTSNSQYNAYLGYFDWTPFNNLPASVEVNSFSIKTKAYSRNTRTTTYAPRLYNGTAYVQSTGQSISSSSAVTVTFNNPSITFDQLKAAGNDFTIGFHLRKTTNGGSTTYTYIYGAEINVTYTMPTSYDIVVTNNSNVNVSPMSGSVYYNENYTLNFSNVTDIATLSVIDNGNNITGWLSNTSGNNYSYQFTNVNVDHNIVLNTVQAFDITTSTEVSNIATISPSGRAGQGSDYSVSITKAENRNSIRVYDGNNDVTDQLTVGQVLTSKSATFIPNTYGGLTNFTVGTGTAAPSSGYTDSSSTTSATFTLGTSSTGSVYYTFDLSDIPNDAIIDSVSCSAKIRVSNTSRVTNTNIQLYSGETAKGSPSGFSTTSTSNIVTLNTGTWTREELNNIRLKFGGTGSSSGQTKAIYFYGASLTINYSAYEDSNFVKKYTINNVQSAHTITVRENTNYILTTESTFSEATISPVSKKIYIGEEFESLIEVYDINSIVVKDNGTDVTSIVRSQYHSGDSVFNLSSYEGGTMTVTNEANAYSTLTSNNYASLRNVSGNAAQTYSLFKFNLSSIPRSATINSVTCRVQICRSTTSTMSNCYVVLQCNGDNKGSTESVTGTSTSNIISLTNTGSWTREELDDCILKCNCQVSSGNTYGLNLYGAELTVDYDYCGYSLTNVTAVHNIVVEEAPYLLIFGSSSLSGASFSNLPKKIYTSGSSFTVQLSGISNVYSFRLSDNNIDKTSQVNTSTLQYSISNITADHELVLSEAPYYAVTGTANFGTGFSGLSNKVYEGDSIVVTLLGITNPLSFKLYDNNVDVTSSVNTANWEYALSNVQEAHALRIEEATYYSVSGTVTNFSGVGFSGLPSKVYDGDSFTFTLTGITNEYSFYLFDNGGDATASVDVGNNYQVIYNNVHEGHTFEIREKPYYSVTTNSSFTGVTISGGSNKVYVGQEVVITISGTTNIHSLKLEDNDDDVSSSIVQSGNTFTYTILGVVEDHVIVLSEADHHTVTASSNHATASISVSPATMYSGEGFVAEITIPDGTNPYSIKLLDNNEDVTHNIEYIIAEEPSYEVENITTNYGFALNANDYYESNNQGTSSTAAICRVTFDLPVQCTVTFNYINYAEATYDFGVFGKVDTTLSTSAWTSSSSGGDTTTDAGLEERRLNTSAYNTSSVQTLVYTINAGEHYIDIKYATDAATNENNDSLQWKIISIEPLEIINEGIRYSLDNVTEDHTLLLTTESICTISKLENYNGATLSFSNSSPYRYEPITITLNVSDISLVTVTATALSTTKAITGKFEEVSNGVYEAIYIPKGDTTIEVKQHIDYTVTATDNATNATMTPTGTLTIEAGYDAEYIVETNYFNRVYLKDNNVIVNDNILYHEAVSSTDIFIPDRYDATNSNVAGTDSTNTPTNGLTDANSTTRAAFTSNTTANSTTSIYYAFDCSSIPENAIIDSISCSFKATCSSNYFNTRVGQLCSGTTKKGAGTTITNTSINNTVNVQSISDCGTWTRAELDNIKILIEAVRGTSTNAFTISFYGATLTINWHVPEHYSYTIESISTNHTILLQDRPTYQVTASSNVSGSTISPASQTIYEDNPAIVTVSTDELFRLKLLDNGAKVTLMSSGDDYTYTIDSVMEAHTLLLDRLLSPYLKVNGSWVDYSRIFKKINGIWVEQVTMEGVFEDGKVYMLDN